MDGYGERVRETGRQAGRQKREEIRRIGMLTREGQRGRNADRETHRSVSDYNIRTKGASCDKSRKQCPGT